MTDILNELREIKELLQLNQPIFSLSQFCKFANISKDFAYKLTSTGAIKFYRPFGKKIYIDREEAIEFLKQNYCDKSTDKKIEKYFLNHKNQ